MTIRSWEEKAFRFIDIDKRYAYSVGISGEGLVIVSVREYFGDGLVSNDILSFAITDNVPEFIDGLRASIEYLEGRTRQRKPNA
jgi:hypothetical protein